MTHRERREQLFATFAANLALYWKESQARFVCPLCLNIFDRTSIDQLDLAHIVPAALGGRITTLTCRRCNVRIGTEIEAHEIKKFHTYKAMTSRDSKPLRARIFFRNAEEESTSIGVVMNGIVGKPVPELYFKTPEKMSNPVEIDRLWKMFEKTAKNKDDGWKLTIEWRNDIDAHRAHTTYLHIAYLCLFHQFGYEWIIDPHRDNMRIQFQRPAEELVPVRVFSLGDVPEHLRNLSVHLIREPQEAIGFLVAIPHLEHIGSWVGVWMPLFQADYTPPEVFPKGLQLGVIPDLHRELSDSTAFARGRFIIMDYFHRHAPQYLDLLPFVKPA